MPLIASESPSRKKKRVRSEFRENLSFVGFVDLLEGTEKELAEAKGFRTRRWVNPRGLPFYDCECGSRKPCQDMGKIRKHLQTHLRMFAQEQPSMYAAPLERDSTSRSSSLLSSRSTSSGSI
jgi:hypothetical protein